MLIGAAIHSIHSYLPGLLVYWDGTLGTFTSSSITGLAPTLHAAPVIGWLCERCLWGLRSMIHIPVIVGVVGVIVIGSVLVTVVLPLVIMQKFHCFGYHLRVFGNILQLIAL